MSNQRNPKKSEVLEVRIAHEAKEALMRKAQQEGRSASAVIREFIAGYVAEERQEARPMLTSIWKPAIAAGALSLAILGSVLTPTRASAGPDLKQAFDRFDRDRDGAITLAEFSGMNSDVRYFQQNGPAPAGKAEGPFVIPLRRDAPPSPPQGAMVPPKELLQSEFGSQDGDGNGSVSFAEFEQYHLSALNAGFAALDSDGNGYLDGAEYRMATERAPDGLQAEFGDLDSDQDGRISRDEFFS